MTLIARLDAARREHDPRGWVESWRSFPGRELRRVGIESPLFAIAEDVVAPGRGFGRHGHRDMEIVSYAIDGALAHEDSTGRTGVLRPGEIQHMSAGAGVSHSEMNASAVEPVRFLQIWIEPERKGLHPAYAHAAFDASAPLVQLAGHDAGIVQPRQAIAIWRAAPADGESVRVPVPSGAPVWAHVVRGEAALDGVRLAAGDGAAVGDVPSLSISGVRSAELLLFVQHQPTETIP